MTSSTDSGSTARPRAADRAGTLTAVAEALFDELTRQAADACGTPVAALSLVEDGHHWFKSRGGVSAADTPLALRLCSEAVQSRDGLVLPDLELDARFSGGPGAEGLRFFAGVPILTSRAGAIGTLSVMDHSPRVFGEEALEALRNSPAKPGGSSTSGSGPRRCSRARPAPLPAAGTDAEASAPAEPEFRQLVERSPVGTYVIQDERYRYANPKLGEILGYSPGELVGAEVAPFVVEADRPAVLARIRGFLVGDAAGARTASGRSARTANSWTSRSTSRRPSSKARRP